MPLSTYTASTLELEEATTVSGGGPSNGYVRALRLQWAVHAGGWAEPAFLIKALVPLSEV